MVGGRMDIEINEGGGQANDERLAPNGRLALMIGGHRVGVCEGGHDGLQYLLFQTAKGNVKRVRCCTEDEITTIRRGLDNSDYFPCESDIQYRGNKITFITL